MPDERETNVVGAPVAGGLTSAEAAERRARQGPNSIAEPARPHVLFRVLAQLRDAMILLLLAAAVLTIALGDVTDTAVILFVVVLNTSVGVVQEVRAERALSELRKLSAPVARAVRDGVEVLVSSEDLVTGDVIKLEAGDVVPADADLIEAVSFQTDESRLTGESVPISKTSSPGSRRLLSGTVVTRGRGTAEVGLTGSASALGRIAGLLAATHPRPTPLQQRLAELSRVLAAAALALSGVVAAVGVMRGESLATMAITAVSLAVAAVPESLPAVVTLALALGAHRMAQRSALVRRLASVETLGAVSVLATDKTGTLTQNVMLAQHLWVAGQQYDVTGAGYVPVGSIRARGEHNGPALTRLLHDVVLCNDAELHERETPGSWSAIGDPTEAALLTLAAKAGVDVVGVRSSAPRVSEVPFDSTAKQMTTRHLRDRGLVLTVRKGAPESVLRPGELRLDEASAEMARQWADEMAANGFRVLAVADRSSSSDEALGSGSAFDLVGLVAIADPPRDDASAALARFRAAGIRLLLITGDHPGTARAIARRVGIVDGATRVIVGGELAETLASQPITSADVYARIRPEQKLDIVTAWQRRGDVVAMTGDGVNDAPALKAADIGVAMGAQGTEVARQAADLVLLDDNLSTITAAIEEGRRIYANVRRFLRYALSGGLAELVVMLVGPFIGLGVPLLPAQILWINMITHGIPGVALGAEPADPASMRQRPRPPTQSVLGGGLVPQIILTGGLIALVSCIAAWWTRSTSGPWQTVLFLVLGLAQLGVALALRQRRSGARRGHFLDLAVGGALALQLAAVYLSPLSRLLGTSSLTPGELAVSVAVAAIPGSVVWATDVLEPRAEPATHVLEGVGADKAPRRRGARPSR
jgi:P-type Ca2+ transporter type 2C